MCALGGVEPPSLVPELFWRFPPLLVLAKKTIHQLTTYGVLLSRFVFTRSG